MPWAWVAKFSPPKHLNFETIKEVKIEIFTKKKKNTPLPPSTTQRAKLSPYHYIGRALREKERETLPDCGWCSGREIEKVRPERVRQLFELL